MSEITRGTRCLKSEVSRAAAPFALLLLASVGCSVPEPDPVGGGNTGTPSGGTSAGSDSGGSSSGGTAGVSTGGVAGSSGSAGSAGSAGSLDCSAPTVGGSPLRRLTRREYNNVVRELLGDTTRPADQFVPESAQSGFTNSAESTLLSSVVIDDFERAATALAREATTPSKLAGLVGCDPNAAAEQDACAATFIQDFGARAFRRPLEAQQVTDYQTLYASSKASYGFPVAIELVLRSILQSPHFLYRLEFGVPRVGRRDGRSADPRGNRRETLVPLVEHHPGCRADAGRSGGAPEHSGRGACSGVSHAAR